MYCRNCGKQIDDAAAFCPYCGAKTDVAEAPASDGFFDSPSQSAPGEGYTYSPPPAGYYQQPSSGYEEQSNGMALAGFICAFFFPVLGWIFGGIGLSRSKKCGGKGKGLSIAAIVIATVMWLVSTIVYINVYERLLDELMSHMMIGVGGLL